jgi:hypothetical protein
MREGEVGGAVTRTDGPPHPALSPRPENPLSALQGGEGGARNAGG